MTRLSKQGVPKFIRCNFCRFKEKNICQVKDIPEIEGLEALYLIVCRRCQRTSLSFQGNLQLMQVQEFIESFVDDDTLLGSQPLP